MTSTMRRASGSASFMALVRRECVRFVRQPARMIASVGTALVLWIFLSSGLGSAMDRGGMGAGDGAENGAYMLAIAPSMATLAMLFSSIFGAISLIEDRHSGFLQAALVSPAPRWSIAMAKSVSASLLALAQACVIMLPVAFLHDRVGILDVASTLVPLACVSLGVAGLSMALAWRVDSVQGFHGVMNLVLMPMWLLSGGVFPLDQSSPWLRMIAMADPLTWPTRLMQGMLSPEKPPTEPAWILWTATIGFGLGGLALAWRTLGSGRLAR